MRSPHAVPVALSLLLAAAVACGEGPTTPTPSGVAAAQEPGASEQPEAPEPADYQSMSERELLLAVMGRLDALEARWESETRAVYARVDSLLSRDESRVTLAAARGGTNRPVQAADGNAWDLEARLCVNGGVSGGANVTKSFFLRPSFLTGVAITPMDYSVTADVGVGVEEVGVGAHGKLQAKAGLAAAFAGSGSVGATFTICNKGWEVRTKQAGANLALEAEQVASQMQALASQINLDAGSLGQAVDAIRDGFGSPSLDPSFEALPLPADVRSVLSNPASIRDRLVSDMWQMAERGSCDPGLFAGVGSGIIESTCEVRDRIDPARFVDTFDKLATVDLGALADLKDACGGRGLKDCMSALDGRISRLCDTSGSLRTKLANGIFHSNSDFRLKVIDLITGREGNDNVTVTGVPAVGWNCATLLES